MSRTPLFALNAVAAFLLVAATWFAVNAPELARIGPGALALTAPAPAKPPLPPAPHTRVVAAPAEGGLRPLVFERSSTEPTSLRPRRADAPPAARGVIAPPVAPTVATAPPATPFHTPDAAQSPAAALASRPRAPAAVGAEAPSSAATEPKPAAATEAEPAQTTEAQPAQTTEARPAQTTEAQPAQTDEASAAASPAFIPPSPLRRPEPPAEVAALSESDDADEAQATADGGGEPVAAPSTAVAVPAPGRPSGETPRSVAEAATSAPAVGFGPTEGMILLGVFKTRSGDRAMVRVEGKGVASVRLGDEVAGWRVARINETTVQLRRGGQSRMLELPEPSN